MKKNYVLDTNILLHDPYCLTKFEDNTVWITHPVIEELDKFKSAGGETGYNAREVIRQLDEIGKKGDLIEGVKLDNGGILRLYITDWLDLSELPVGWDTRKMDNIILLSVKAIEKDLIGKALVEAKEKYERELKKDNNDKTQENDDDTDMLYNGFKDLVSESELMKDIDIQVILVCNDSLMRKKACMMDIDVQEYQNDRVKSEKLYTGRSIRHLTDKNMSKFATEGHIDVSELYDEDLDAPIRNEYITLLSWTNSSFLAKYDGQTIRKLDDDRVTTYLDARNTGQRFLQHSLMTSYDEKPLTICCGPAGTGKTLFAVACGLEQVMEKEVYKKVLICRANIMMDEEIGFLPGGERDKIDPLLRGAYDNLEKILRNEEDTNDEYEDKITDLFQRGYIDAQSVGYLRGRSIANTYMIIDEAQNCTPNQILSIITRAGENTKIVLLGDTNQIDNSRLDKRNNGLAYALERMKGSALCDIITFEESECTRSPLAKEASERLKR